MAKLYNQTFVCLLVVFDTLALRQRSSLSSGITVVRYFFSSDTIYSMALRIENPRI